MSIYDQSIAALDGAPLDLGELQGKVVLVVNVASKCGLTPQYEGLEALQRRFGDRGMTVLGAPCNQFAGQESGSPEEIATFCSSTYGVTFPVTEKVDVNGQHQHPLFAALTAVPDDAGEAGEVQWNFEKFLVGRDGKPVARFRPPIEPESEVIVSAIEDALARPSDTAAKETWVSCQADEVTPGSAVRLESGEVVEATRIDRPFLGRPEMLAFVEDTPQRWYKRPARIDATVEVLATTAS